MEKLTKKGLDGTQLKTIALVLMVLDHIHYFFVFNPVGFKLLDSISDPVRVLGNPFLVVPVGVFL